jgi:hypothetical protein
MEYLNNKVEWLHIKKSQILPKPRLVACLLASDFLSENPRTQNRTILIHKRYLTYKE